MLLHPSVAKKAQKEIDDVVGDGRLPTFDDRPELPYVECILKELYRLKSRTQSLLKFSHKVFCLGGMR